MVVREFVAGRKKTVACAVFASFVWLFAFPGFSQQEEMSASGMLTEVARLLTAEQYDESVPYLTGYISRMSGTEDDRVQALVQEVRLKLGEVMLTQGDLIEAVSWLQEYLDHSPVNKRREALKFSAVALLEQGEYIKCVEVVANALAEPPPSEPSTKKEEIRPEELSKEELGGLTARQLKRLESYAEGATGDLFKEPSNGGPEPDYTSEDLVLLNNMLGDAFFGLGRWLESLDPYRYVLEKGTEAGVKGDVLMKTVTALIELKKHEEVRDVVAQLYRTDARYDLRVNMALMSAAMALYDAEQYESALSLYRMILPRQALVDYQTVKMNEQRNIAGLPEAVVKTVTNATGQVETLFGARYGDVAQGVVDEQQKNGFQLKPMALVEIEEQIGTLLSLPPYENEVMYRTARVYADAGRPWEARTLFRVVYELDLEGEFGLQSFCCMLAVMIDPLKEYDEAEHLGRGFLEQHKEGVAPRQVACLLSGMYQQQNRMAEIKKLMPVILGFVPSSDPVILQYECELYYLQAVADLMLLNYPAAAAGFQLVLTKFPGSHQQDNASYWHAMSLLFLQKYPEALAEFDAYHGKFSAGNWVDAASFRGGVCLFGMENYEAAQKRFTHVIETWPDSAICPDACSLRGDILGSQGRLDEAVLDYREAITKARKPEQATYAVFQMAAVFESESRYSEIIAAVHDYMDRYGEQADIAKAMYWIGKTQIQQGFFSAAVHSYLDTIIKYGGEVRQDGVDLILSELATTASLHLDPADLAKLQTEIQFAANSDGSDTLKLRLRVLLARLNGTELELGRELLQESVDMDQSSPPVLAVVCKASFEQKDYSRAAEILNLFKTRFEDSELMEDVYKLRGFDLYAAGDLDAALKIINEAQATYGTDAHMAWAQLMKGRIFLQQGSLDMAREAFLGVVNVRSWRGAPYAEATFCMGNTEEKAGAFRKAFGWYQRTYIQYKGYANGYWAAEAYLASARCLEKLEFENDRRNTFRAMLFDKYVNTLPQAETARRELGRDEVESIRMMLDAGVHTNLTITVDGEVGQ